MPNPAKKFPNSNFSLSQHTRTNYDSRVRKTAQNYINYRNCDGNNMEGKLGGADETSMMEVASGVSTPQLLGAKPSTSPPHGMNIHYKCLSPSSKAQAIARGQKELMEMVSSMPESCFELTLKDIVEHEHKDVDVGSKQESVDQGKGPIDNQANGKKKMKKKNSKPEINRSGSIDNGGFLLKMVFPFSIGSKSKKKTKESIKNHNSKVSPKPTVSDNSGKNIDKEWWKKRSGSSESDGIGSDINSGSTKSSRSSSTGSSSSSRRGSIHNTRRRHMENGCLGFIFNTKSRASR